MIYVYAITDLYEPPALERGGIDARPLLLRHADGISALCSEHQSGRIPASRENIWRHEKVAESAMELGAVLPARFATCFEDCSRLDEVLRGNHSRIEAALSHVRGCVEMGVRVMNPSDLAPAPQTTHARDGREYLLMRAEQERRVEAQRGEAAALHDELARGAIDSSMRVRSAPQLMSGAYLIAREKIDYFRQRVWRLSESHLELRIVGTGPWPPYHFVPALQLEEPCHV